MGRKLTEDNLEDLRNDYGVLTTKEITEKYQCSYSTIERFCKSHGFKSKREPTYYARAKYQYLADHLDEFLTDWEEHILTEDELIEKYKAPMTALYSQAKLYGKHRKTLEERIDVKNLIYDYTINEMSQNDIYEKYGISQTSKSKILKNNNIQLFPVGSKSRKYYFNEHYLDEINTEEKAYFLGFVYADGGHSTERKTLNITIQEPDQAILNKFYDMFECNREIYHIYNKKYERYYANFCLQSTYLSGKLLELGVPSDKSFKIRFPEWLNKELYRHFIRGYFDGDGSIGVSQRGWKSTSIQFCGNPEFLTAIQNILTQNTSIEMNLYPEQHSRVYDLRKGGIHNLYPILNYLYKDSTIYLQRKYDRYVDFVTEYEKEYLNNDKN